MHSPHKGPVTGKTFPYYAAPSHYHHMMTSSNRNIFRVTGHLCGEFIGPRWNPRTKASDAELNVFLDLRLNKRLSKQSWGWWFETLPHPLWLHSTDFADLLICIEHILWKILEACTNACCVYSDESVSKMELVILVTLFSSQYVGFYVLSRPNQV